MKDEIEEFLLQALREDWGRGDLFEKVAQDEEVQAYIIAKESGVFSGQKYIKRLCALMEIELECLYKDAEAFNASDVLLRMQGSYLKILKIERVALNLLQHSSGIATQTAKFVKRLEGHSLKILDTRKTRPLLRALEKYSVCNGGGQNHRFGLDDALMLKDTHLSRLRDLKGFITQARKKLPFTTKIEVECESVEQVREAFESGAEIVMCDNMALSQIAEVVKMREAYPHILLEASGNINLDNVVEYAKVGVDAISIGALIHQATWIDLSLKICE